MKITVIGLEWSEGIGKESKQPYSIGKIHASVGLDTSRNGPKGSCKGGAGTEYRVDAELVKRLEHLPLPFSAELAVEDVMRFGKRESKVMDCRPLSLAKDAAPANQAPALAKAA